MNPAKNGSDSSTDTGRWISRPTAQACRETRLRPRIEGTQPSRWAMPATRSRVCSETPSRPFKAAETVLIATPASRATSVMVTRPSARRAGAEPFARDAMGRSCHRRRPSQKRAGGGPQAGWVRVGSPRRVRRMEPTALELPAEDWLGWLDRRGTDQLQAARDRVAQLVAAEPGSDTILPLWNDASIALRNAGAIAGLLSSVHPDAAVIERAEALEVEVEGYSTDLYLDTA